MASKLLYKNKKEEAPMKFLYVLLTTTLLLCLSYTGLAAPSPKSSTVKYTYETSDLKVIGHGKDINAARSNASEACFDLRIKQFQKVRGHLPDEEQVLYIIDSCVNI
ncbi:MAG: hypothetical protein D6797_02500 [Bdellovibrio sp.]|nr:MAG: hypothetical protein D6797_02500 [Bdellovibrio sp.]